MLLALTGGVATGKSTFRRLLEERHTFEVFDADACVHDLLASDRAIIACVAREFGESALDSSGAVDRAVLRQIVFADREARQKLEAILHPAVRARWQEMLSSRQAASKDFLADIPLLYETSAEGYFDAVAVVAASPKIQRERLAARGLDSGTVDAMLASQLPIGDKVGCATTVVWNDGTLGALARQADLLLERLFSTQS